MVVAASSRLSPASFLDFVQAPGPAVVYVSLRFGLPLNRTLLPRLARLEEPVRVGQVELLRLARENRVAVGMLRAALQQLGLRRRYVPPGYYFFDRGRLLAWESGLPSPGDARRIVRGALLGLVWSAVQKRVSLIGRGLDLSAEDAIAKRMTSTFRRALVEQRARRPSVRPPAPLDELSAAYALLGIAQTASPQAVRDAWRRKLVESHPDRAAQDPLEHARRTRRAAEINRAYHLIESFPRWEHKRSSSG